MICAQCKKISPWPSYIQGIVLAWLFSVGVTAQPLVSYQVTDDAIPAPLVEKAGDPQRGRELIEDTSLGGCLLCHGAPGIDQRFTGNLGPPLAGVGKRLSESQIRLRLVDPSRVNPTTIMPAYYRVKGLRQVAEAFRHRPILTAEEIEHIIAYLVTLKEL